MDEIWVLPDAPQGSSVHTAAFAETWYSFIRFHKYRKPVSDGKSAATYTKSKKPIDEDILAALMLEFPWMTMAELLALLTTKAQSGDGGGGGSRGASSSSSGGDVAVADAVFSEVLEDLEAVREQWAGDAGAGEAAYFNVKILGGQWSVSKFKTQIKDVGSYPKDKDVAFWCRAVGWPPSEGQKSFAVSKFGLDGATHLAAEMSRRGSYFMHCWVSAGSPAPFAFRPLLGGYKAPEDYTTWFEDLPITSACFKAAMVIMDLCPNDMPA